MSNQITYKASSDRATGISAAALNAGANLLSDEIDNATNLQDMLDLELQWTCAVASTANDVVEVRLLIALDGANYEDGGIAVDSKKTPIANFIDDGGTGAQRQARLMLPIPPHKFKLLLTSELDQDATSVTLTARTYSHDIADT